MVINTGKWVNRLLKGNRRDDTIRVPIGFPTSLLVVRDWNQIDCYLLLLHKLAHHGESTGGATDFISAALIIADKTDVRRNRVRTKAKASFDIHDCVNYAVTKNE
ncbi:MAG: hypothetical protein KBT48_02185 [Firmicutes bacterium]|nr:hypothetical protein [Bacillota bacterium]